MRIDYPRRGRAGARRFLPSWRQWLLLVAAGFVLVVAGFAVLYAKIDVPKPNDQALQQSSVVYFSDGRSVLGRFGQTNRQSVPLSQVPISLQRAVLAAEDRQFYEHGGFSPTGILRAAWNDLRGGSLEGGSTITQQLVKNYYLSQQRTLKRKVDEFVVSIKIEQQLSKDQILQDYLNTIYFGRGAYGVQAAALAYFHTNVQNLTPEQGAVLAAILQRTGLVRPGDAHGRAADALGLRARRRGDRGVDDPAAARGCGVPDDRTAHRGRTQRPERLPRGVRGVRARSARHLPGRPGRGRPEGLHVDRREGAGRRGRRRRQGAPEERRQGCARRARLRRPADRRHRRDVRRSRLRATAVHQRRDAVDRAGRLDVQGLHAGRRAEGRHPARLALGRQERAGLHRRARQHDQADLQRGPRELRPHHPPAGDRGLGQHRVRRRREPAGGRRRFRGPGRPATPASPTRSGSTRRCRRRSVWPPRRRWTWPRRTARSRPAGCATHRPS